MRKVYLNNDGTDLYAIAGQTVGCVEADNAIASELGGHLDIDKLVTLPEDAGLPTSQDLLHVYHHNGRFIASQHSVSETQRMQQTLRSKQDVINIVKIGSGSHVVDASMATSAGTVQPSELGRFMVRWLGAAAALVPNVGNEPEFWIRYPTVGWLRLPDVDFGKN